MKRRFLKFAFFVALAMTIPVPGYTAENTAEHEFFEKRIRPILVRHCYECHASSLKEPKGGLRLDWRDGIRKGGESGPAVVPGNVDKSLLIGAIRHETLEMPPETKLPDAVISDFVQWIEMGAHDPRDAPPTADDVAALPVAELRLEPGREVVRFVHEVNFFFLNPLRFLTFLRF